MNTTKDLKLIPIDKLIPYVNNARTHTIEQIQKLRSSLREFGFVNPVIIDEKYNVIAGHGRNLKAYMDAKEYDHLMRSYAFSEISRVWDAIFQSCMLFRKAGLRLDESEEFTYPRKTDVSLMQQFRQLWEASREEASR